MFYTCEELLKKYRSRNTTTNAEKITFKGADGKDVYNITAPFIINGEEIIAGRVEARDSENAEIYFFKNTSGIYEKKEDAVKLTLQDPFFTMIKEEIIVGGVEIYKLPENSNMLGWKTVLYKGTDLTSLVRFFEGPKGMKDLRICLLKDDKIAILTRPQGEKGGRGKIGFTKVNSLEDITIECIENAPLLSEFFIDKEWGGGNEIHPLTKDTIGILGHIASFDKEENRHYYPIAFKLNTNTLEYSDVKIIAERKDFKPGDAKRPDLDDVVFSGGLKIIDENRAILYAGISDAEAQKIDIENPFN